MTLIMTTFFVVLGSQWTTLDKVSEMKNPICVCSTNKSVVCEVRKNTARICSFVDMDDNCFLSSKYQNLKASFICSSEKT